MYNVCNRTFTMWMKIFLLALLIGSALSLTCLPCGMLTCVEPQGCLQGTVSDVCGCCRRCAKVEGETCGGLWNMDGRCAVGLFCGGWEIHDGEEQVVPIMFGMTGVCFPVA
ncbi:PREDICTED: venom protein 302-like [Branchiostoma belcheri]|uniref:Venom protein 302-like n=1 Tax=Branchiostoma belcheri TaxID=7741 RepID=A0A6P4Z566_BRABE|nr:PREDICTED: venom protein 302-like [Branchiostoma belcheri]